MNTSVEEIKTRGHWEISIRPQSASEVRISNVLELSTIVQTAVIRATGWPYPAIMPDPDAVRVGTSWVEFGFHADSHNEMWRLHQSGHFLHYLGFMYDWLDPRNRPRRQPSAKSLGVSEVVHVFTHVARFARNLSRQPSLREALAISVDAREIADRHLFIEAIDRGDFVRPQVATIPSFLFETVAEPEELENHCDHIACNGAIELFRRFGWDTSTEVVRSLQPRPTP